MRRPDAACESHEPANKRVEENNEDCGEAPPSAAVLRSISILIPTLNSARTLSLCLTAIRDQDYPKTLVEIIVADGGSTDGTQAIAASYGARVFDNPGVTGETGKAVALSNARNELAALVDSDNILTSRDWLKRMVAPFDDEAIVASEPIRFDSERCDTIVDRYCALAGVNDPLCLFIGNYDRCSAVTGRWTGIELVVDKQRGYLSFSLSGHALPTIGANGTIYRREVLNAYVSDFLADIDIPYRIGAAQRGARFAKVDIGIRHLYCRDVKAFARKQTRRIRDFFHSDTEHERSYPWASIGKRGIVIFIVSCLTVYPILLQTFRAYRRTGDLAALFHPAACWITLAVYGWNTLFARGRVFERKGWAQ